MTYLETLKAERAARLARMGMTRQSRPVARPMPLTAPTIPVEVTKHEGNVRRAEYDTARLMELRSEMLRGRDYTRFHNDPKCPVVDSERKRFAIEAHNRGISDHAIATFMGRVHRNTIGNWINASRDWLIVQHEPFTPDYPPRLAEILRAVSMVTGFSITDLASDRRGNTLVRARQAFMYLARKHTGRSYPDIGKFIGRRDHTTILYGVRRVAASMDAYALLISRVEDALGLKNSSVATNQRHDGSSLAGEKPGANMVASHAPAIFSLVESEAA